MSITGESKFADDAFKPTAETLKLLYGETWGKGYDMGFDAGYASADAWFVDHDDELAEHGWVRLPVDADGKPIHRGDKLYGYDTTITAGRMVLNENGWMVQHTYGTFWYDPANLRHVEHPTVEDVLIKMLETAVGYSDAHTTVAYSVVSEYADKLQLRED